MFLLFTLNNQMQPGVVLIMEFQLKKLISASGSHSVINPFSLHIK